MPNNTGTQKEAVPTRAECGRASPPPSYQIVVDGGKPRGLHCAHILERQYPRTERAPIKTQDGLSAFRCIRNTKRPQKKVENQSALRARLLATSRPGLVERLGLAHPLLGARKGGGDESAQPLAVRATDIK